MSIQIVDQDGHLITEQELSEYFASVAVPGAMMADEAIRQVGVNYHVVSVFGGQSSGKSTLLNHLFGTDFQTLDSTVRRGQTTKGAFLSHANTVLEPAVAKSGDGDTGAEDVAAPKTGDSGPVLVIDFEGTDGLERGDDQSFGHQLSLLGLCVADTLIVNMWTVEVGRFYGANLTTLRTIFEVNLQLFSHTSYQKDEKPTLLIVLRDFTEEDFAPILTTVRNSFDTIWESIHKPEAFANSTIDSLFVLRYYTMPHFQLQRPAFMESVYQFRRWFLDTTSDDYLFKYRSMFRGVPMEGLPAYLTSCWKAILSSKDLDIPTQRELLAQHRSAEVKELELKTFLSFCRHYEDRLNRGEMLLRLSEILDEEMSARLAEYTRQTKLYSSIVVEANARDLEESMVTAAVRVVQRLSKSISSEVLCALDPRLQSAVDDSVRGLLKSAQDLPFCEGRARNAPSEGEAESGDDGDDSHREPPASSFTAMNDAACHKIVDQFWKRLSHELNAALDELHENPSSVQLYRRYASLVSEDPSARADVVNTVTLAAFAKVKSRLVSMSESACDTMHRCFEQCLTHNSDGTIKFFATSQGLQSAVPPAQQASLVLMEVLLYFRLRLAPVADGNRGLDADDLSCTRTAKRAAQDRCKVAVRGSHTKEKFCFRFTTLDTMPRYPSNVQIAPAPTEDADEESEGDGVCGDCVLLSQQSAQRAYDLFMQKCDFTTQLQLRSLEATKQRLPAWVFPALLILGWNELLYVITTPLVLIFVIMIATIFFKQFFIAQWHAFEETGPVPLVMTLQAAIRYLVSIYSYIVPIVTDHTTTPVVHAPTPAEGAETKKVETNPGVRRHADPSGQTGALPPSNTTQREHHRENRKMD